MSLIVFWKQLPGFVVELKAAGNYKSAGWEVLMKSLIINEECLLGSLDDMWTCATWGLSEKEQRTKLEVGS